MTKISRIPLRPDVWERIFDIFIGTLADLKDKKKLEAFINDFFSPGFGFTNADFTDDSHS